MFNCYTYASNAKGGNNPGATRKETRKKTQNLMRLWRRFDRQDQAKIARAGTIERPVVTRASLLSL